MNKEDKRQARIERNRERIRAAMDYQVKTARLILAERLSRRMRERARAT